MRFVGAVANFVGQSPPPANVCESVIADIYHDGAAKGMLPHAARTKCRLAEVLLGAARARLLLRLGLLEGVPPWWEVVCPAPRPPSAVSVLHNAHVVG